MKQSKTMSLRIVLAILVAVAGFVRCGSDAKSKNSPKTPVTVMGELPADWDARSDWTGSQWSVENP